MFNEKKENLSHIKEPNTPNMARIVKVIPRLFWRRVIYGDQD